MRSGFFPYRTGQNSGYVLISKTSAPADLRIAPRSMQQRAHAAQVTASQKQKCSLTLELQLMGGLLPFSSPACAG